MTVSEETYVGKHQPLVSRELFDVVQRLLKRRRPNKRIKHCFKFSRRSQCSGCGRCLVGEKQKSHIYYRCGKCPGVCVREDRILVKNPQFELLPELVSLNEPLLEPLEKFDSPWVGAKSLEYDLKQQNTAHI